MFGLNEAIWKERNGLNTAKEIYQQPRLWLETLKVISSNKNEIQVFFDKFKRNKNTKIIFTGAGTSAYVGEIIAAYLNSKYNFRFESIPTTDIVSNPRLYLESELPTIIVSFARSGNSPESIATYQLAEKIIKDVHHVFITCNSEGKLAKIANRSENNLLLLMPKKSNDKGFAMTSSFTNMLLASLLMFDLNHFDESKVRVEELSKLGTNILEEQYRKVKQIVDLNYDRVVFLGSGNFKGLAQESALKLLELTRGKIISHYESSLGFRHGPKSIVNDKTLVFVYVSDDKYTRKYDLDIVKELYGDSGNHRVITISNGFDSELERYSDYHWYLTRKPKKLIDTYISIVFVLYAQLFALLTSLELGIEPDNPSPRGTVNRVVKGVNIYEYKF